MPQKDYIGSKIVVKQKLLTFDMDELYKMLRTWFEDRNYEIVEKDFQEHIDEKGIRHTYFKWVISRKADNYTKLTIDLEFNSATKDVVIEKETKTIAQRGSVEVSFRPYLLKDIEEEWRIREKGVIRKFLRELYDKVFGSDKFESYTKKLESDMQAVIADVKTFLRVRRFE